MKYIFIIYSIILSPLLAIQLKPKFCIDCKFYKNNIFTDSKFGKCSLFPKDEDNIDFLVNGNKNNNIEYHYCSTSRLSNGMCGKEAEFYDKK
jgi:hypothetical protein